MSCRRSEQSLYGCMYLPDLVRSCAFVYLLFVPAVLLPSFSLPPAAMLVDDAQVFAAAAPPEHPPYTAAASTSAVHASQTPSIRLVSDMAVQHAEESVDDQDQLGLLHRRRAGYMSKAAATAAFWSMHPMPGPMGRHAASGPQLSPPCRERMLLSLEHDAPAAVLQECRALARGEGHTGVSAWRAIRERERVQSTAGPSNGRAEGGDERERADS